MRHSRLFGSFRNYSSEDAGGWQRKTLSAQGLHFHIKREKGESICVYFVAQYVVNDPALYGEYAQGAGPHGRRVGGEVICFDVAAETMRSRDRCRL